MIIRDMTLDVSIAFETDRITPKPQCLKGYIYHLHKKMKIAKDW